MTAGSGTTILTDDTGASGHAQVVKLAIATDGSATLIPADANGLTVKQGTAANLNVTEASAATALTALQLIDDSLFADDSGFTAGTSKVSMAGFMADDATPDSADEGDAVAARTTLDRKVIVALGESGANFVKGGGSQTGTSDQALMAASGSASVYNYLCWVSIYNSSSTNTYVNIKDGSTVVAVIPAPAYGGAIVNLTVPIRGTGNTAFNAAAGAGVTTMYMYGGGYKGA